MTGRMSPAEFRENGYLAEVNRRVLHPLGLALVMEVDQTTGEERFAAGVLDCRDDPEGIRYADDDPGWREKAARVRAEEDQRRPAREAALGWWIQPTP